MVWNTTQSSLYEAENARGGEYWREVPLRKRCEPPREAPCGSSCEPVREAPREKPCRKRPEARRGLFDDSDTILILGLLIILMREKSDQKLILALLAVLML